jgi:6-phosphogluconolactonase
MSSDESQLLDNRLAKSSRRNFLKRAAALAAVGPAIAYGRESGGKETQGAGQMSSSGRSRLVYVGSYSLRGPEGGTGHGQGIYLFEMNRATGALTQRAVFDNPRNPSWLALNPSKTHLYTSDEVYRYQGESSGAVTAYAIDSSNGHLTQLNTVSSGSRGPAHISVHPSGRYVLVANYGVASVAVLPIHSDGSLGSPADVHFDKGPVGPKHATDAPPGSFAISGHNAPHAHMIHADPTGRRVISTDLGMDKILIWNFDLETGKLTPNNPHEISVPPGDGPRHFVFHPNGRWFYCIQEEGSAVVAFDYDESSGNMTQKQVISALPKGFVGTNMCSEIRISPDAKFIYGANRLHDSIAIFSIGRDGKLSYAGEEWTHGDMPRSITIEPSGNFLYSCDQNADSVTSFRVNRQTGRLTFTGQYTPVGTPAVMVFLT